MKKLSWEEIYEKCNHEEYSKMTNVLRKASLNSNVKNFISNFGNILLISLVVLLIFLIFTFKNNLIVAVYCILLLSLIFLLMIVYGTYKISLEEDKVKIKINFQENDITYDKLVNIYLSKKQMRIFFIPMHYYTLNIISLIDKENIGIQSFPTVMLNKREILNFFESFETKKIQNVDV